jgi:transcriptional regulator with XRE-family HTH domain
MRVQFTILFVECPRTPTIHAPEYAVILRLLREARLEAGLSQGEVAKQLGYSRTVISKLERGELRLDLLQLRQFCAAVGVPLLTFVQRVEEALTCAVRVES